MTETDSICQEKNEEEDTPILARKDFHIAKKAKPSGRNRISSNSSTKQRHTEKLSQRKK